MPYHVQCPTSGTSAYIDCICPPEISLMPVHMSGCPMLDPDALVECPPDAGCCDGSSHAGLSHGVAANLGHPNMINGLPEPDHDDDHHVDNPACAVCHPLIITAMPGSANLSPTQGFLASLQRMGG